MQSASGCMSARCLSCHFMMCQLPIFVPNAWSRDGFGCHCMLSALCVSSQTCIHVSLTLHHHCSGCTDTPRGSQNGRHGSYKTTSQWGIKVSWLCCTYCMLRPIPPCKSGSLFASCYHTCSCLSAHCHTKTTCRIITKSGAKSWHQHQIISHVWSWISVLATAWSGYWQHAWKQLSSFIGPHLCC